MIAKATEILALDVNTAPASSEIGAAPGVSKQAAQQRFGD